MKIRFLWLIAFLQLINVSYFSCVYAVKPPWINHQPDGYFCGSSSGHLNPDSAISHAMLDVKKQILTSLGERVESVEKITLIAKNENLKNEEYTEETTLKGKAILHLAVKEKYIDSERKKGKKRYSAWVLVPFSPTVYWAEKRALLDSYKKRFGALSSDMPLKQINALEHIITQSKELIEICEYKADLKDDITNFGSHVKEMFSKEFNKFRIKWEPSLKTLLLCEKKHIFVGNVFLQYDSESVENSFEILSTRPENICHIEPGDKLKRVLCEPLCFPVNKVDFLVGTKIGGRYLKKKITVPVENASTEVRIEHAKSETEIISSFIKQKLLDNGITLEQEGFEKKFILNIKTDFDRIDSYGSLEWVRLNVEQSLILDNQSVSTKNFSSKGAGKNVSSALKNAVKKMEKIGNF